MRWVRRHPIATIVLALASLVLVAGYSADAATGSDLLFLYALIGVVWWAVWWVARAIRRWIGRKQRSAIPLATASVSSSPAATPVPPVLEGNAQPGSVGLPTPERHTGRRSAPSLGDVLALTPGEFEDLTVRLLEALGYAEVQRSGGAGDLGVDVMARDRQGRPTIVQCKRYAPGSTLGSPLVQTFVGMLYRHHRAERGIIVTTVPYTEPAIALARSQGIALVDGEALLLLLDLLDVQPVEASVGTPAHDRGPNWCLRCQTGNAPTARFCVDCGAPLTAQPAMG